MSTKYKFAVLSTLLASIALIVACSSSTSSSSGRGQIPTGQYSGNLNGQSPAGTGVPLSTRIILNVVAQLDTTTNPGTISGISGNMIVTGGDRCWSGGTINGSSGGTTSSGTTTSGTTTSGTTTSGTTTSGTTTSGVTSGTTTSASSLQIENTGELIAQIFITQAHAQSVINGNQMTLEIATIQGTLNMTGRVTDDSYSGTFSTDNSDCGPISGGFDLDRV